MKLKYVFHMWKRIRMWNGGRLGELVNVGRSIYIILLLYLQLFLYIFSSLQVNLVYFLLFLIIDFNCSPRINGFI